MYLIKLDKYYFIARGIHDGYGSNIRVLKMYFFILRTVIELNLKFYFCTSILLEFQCRNRLFNVR